MRIFPLLTLLNRPIGERESCGALGGFKRQMKKPGMGLLREDVGFYRGTLRRLGLKNTGPLNCEKLV